MISDTAKQPKYELGRRVVSFQLCPPAVPLFFVDMETKYKSDEVAFSVQPVLAIKVTQYENWGRSTNVKLYGEDKFPLDGSRQEIIEQGWEPDEPTQEISAIGISDDGILNEYQGGWGFLSIEANIEETKRRMLERHRYFENQLKQRT